MATLRLGELAPSHRPEIASILRSTGVFRDSEVDVALELFDESFPTARDSHARATPPASSDYAFLGAFTPEDELAGYACYGPTPATDRTYDLYWIAMRASLAGKGGGTTLLTEVERRLRDSQARLLVVETSSRSEYSPTCAFYRARGYAEAARVRAFYGPADDRIIFTKRLSGSANGRGAVSQ